MVRPRKRPPRNILHEVGTEPWLTLLPSSQLFSALLFDKYVIQRGLRTLKEMRVGEKHYAYS